MALRFRDLGIPTGDTISSHSAIIKTVGYVWWGWWAIPTETIPRDAFAHLLAVARASDQGLEILLVDAGQIKLYKAHLVDMKVSPTDEPIESPEPSNTPRYYTATHCKAWFKFARSIDECSPEEIKTYSYCEESSTVVDLTSDSFTNKMVFDLKEMLGRVHRTLYFLVPFVPSRDRQNEVRLEPPIQPASFIINPELRPSNYIIHLSDLHFGARHGYPLSDSPASPPVTKLLIDDLRQLKKDNPAALIVSGDTTWAGDSNEFGSARSAMEFLTTALGLRARYHLLLVPGNHDIQWAKQAAGDYDKSKPVTFAPEAAENNYRDFFRELLDTEPNKFLSMGRRYLLGNFVSVDLVGLNSTRLENKYFAGYGFIGEDQLQTAASEMKWDSPYRTNYRILVMHHHLMPVSPKEEISTYDRIYSLTLDAGAITRQALANDVDVVAHGHMHQPFLSSLSRFVKAEPGHGRNLCVHGAGSLGVRRTELGEIGKNSYSIYEFFEDSVRVTVRATSDQRTGFEDYWSATLMRDDGHGLRIKD